VEIGPSHKHHCRKRTRRYSLTPENLPDELCAMVVKGYLICTLPRSGSSALCSALRSTRVLGDPREHFNGRFMDTAASRRPSALLDLETYVQAALCAPGLRNGVISSKVFWFQLERARRKLAPDLSVVDAFDRLLKVCGGGLRLVRLIRRNKIRQAISYINAYHTGIWRVVRGSGIVSRQLASYDFAEVDLWSARFSEWERSWDELLRPHQSKVVTIYYEEIMNSIEDGARTIASHMGIDLSVSVISELKSAFIKQSDDGEVEQTVAAFRIWRASFQD
jgi:trehalose 2-sulfotransferase